MYLKRKRFIIRKKCVIIVRFFYVKQSYFCIKLCTLIVQYLWSLRVINGNINLCFSILDSFNVVYHLSDTSHIFFRSCYISLSTSTRNTIGNWDYWSWKSWGTIGFDGPGLMQLQELYYNYWRWYFCSSVN